MLEAKDDSNREDSKETAATAKSDKLSSSDADAPHKEDLLSGKNESSERKSAASSSDSKTELTKIICKFLYNGQHFAFLKPNEHSLHCISLVL